jgi:hypothetical protein
MKLLIPILIIITGLFSCKKLNQPYENLPDSTLINEVIRNIILLDSLKPRYQINSKLAIPQIYKPVHWNNDTIPPPPPPPMALSFDELFYCFGSENNLFERELDSVFITQQADTSIIHILPQSITEPFRNGTRGFYLFYLPIFSNNKETVVVQYWKHCGPLCGSCYTTVLRKVNNKWTLIKGWGCGES